MLPARSISHYLTGTASHGVLPSRPLECAASRDPCRRIRNRTTVSAWTVGTEGLAPVPKRASIERTRRQNGFSRKVSTACRHATENSIGHPAGIQRGVSHEGVLFSVRLFAVTAQLVRKDQMSIYGWVPTMFACAV